MICFIASHGDALELFEFAEEVLDQVPPLVEFGIDIERFDALRSLRDADCCTTRVHVLYDPVAVEGFVGEQTTKIDAFDQRRNAHRIIAMAGQEFEADQIAKGIGQGQDFGCQPAFGLAYSLALSPPFAP